MSVSIKPLEDRIVVKTLEAEQTTASGLVIPDTAKEKPQEGEVLAVGPGRVDDKGNRVPVDVAVGDKVIYSKYGGTEVKYAGEEYLILSARDILAVVQGCASAPPTPRTSAPEGGASSCADPFRTTRPGPRSRADLVCRGRDATRPPSRGRGPRGASVAAQLALRRRWARTAARSSSDMPPHTP